MSFSDILWAKESSQPDALYMDFFQHLDDARRESYDEHRRYLEANKIEKSDKSSRKWQNMGKSTRFRKEATEIYNQSVCTAKSESILRAAYKARDSILAKRNIFDIANIRKEKSLSTSPFDRNENFPSLLSVLKVQENPDYGRHIVATCDIEVGQTIAMEQPFAIVCVHEKELKQQAYCITCYRTDARFIPCSRCANVMFCSQTCLDTNEMHQYECQSIFHDLLGLDIKLAVQSIFIAMKLFPSGADSLIAFVEGILNGPSSDVNDLARKYGNTQRSTYALFLKLHGAGSTTKKFKHFYRTVEFLKTLPEIQRYFDSSRAQRFLVHLLIHHYSIIQKNSFIETLPGDWSGELCIQYIYATISLFNHSCAPNAHCIHRDDIGQLITVRPIKCGEQIYINYLGDDVDEAREKRREQLSEMWEFQCECDRCEPLTSLSEHSEHQWRMEKDSKFEYYENHHNDAYLPIGNEQRNRLKDICAQILNEHGHIWSKRLDDVTRTFVEMCIN